MYATSLYFSVFEKYFSMFKLLRKTYAKTILENIIQDNFGKCFLKSWNMRTEMQVLPLIHYRKKRNYKFIIGKKETTINTESDYPIIGRFSVVLTIWFS
jgi:hypothetical protein